ncbi:hypothetical protein BDN72DRAFT_852596 [Pluteus cervinus]|uniref:Uncharacterized protein n=1 Tax=Pluteus cervinus TaxID=181527 RepID=A0ACD3BHZ8_9AGAR|nr:hypothetical protein BDN72DRAFT_852596 [Pluteus cervinus]
MSDHLSPPPVNDTLPPSWGPPNAPLPAYRLAKLANALGVATPIPAVHHFPPSPVLPNTPNGLPTPVELHYRRSPTPSSISGSVLPSYAPSTSKYLLHVIPPLHLPHDSDAFDANDLILPPPNASGYHAQFRRGILVPFYATFQAQLGAIAKEYALPSTSGLVLYLVNSKPPQPNPSGPSPTPDLDDQEGDEPGPRLSEEIWKHLWTRVAKAEPRDDTLLLPSRSPTPNIFTAPSPTPPPETGPTPPLRPLIATSGLDSLQNQNNGWPVTPSTPSSASDPRSHFKSTASEPGTPDTSMASHSFRAAKRANSLDLPGLSSQSIIPILAKIEFDVDRRKAGWYEPWIRSRRINHAKRAESRMGRKASVAEGAEDKESVDGLERKHHIDLLTGTKDAANHLASLFPPRDSGDTLSDGEPEADGYAPLSDSQDGHDDELNKGELEDEDDYEEDATTRVVSSITRRGGKDPLDDVFGSDADTWADIRESNSTARPSSANPNIVNLALTGSELAALPDGEDEALFDAGNNDEEEVRDILERMSSPTQPEFSISPPTSPPSKRSSSPTTSKKHVPPPLVLLPINGGDLVIPAEATSPLPVSPGTSLPYLHGPSSGSQDNSPLPEQQVQREEEEDLEDDYHVRSSAESEKRVGAVFEELDLGLDPTEEYDENDPHDRRRSQYVMRAQLDQIERTLAQLSPRILKSELEEEPTQSYRSNASTLSPNAFSNNNGQLSPAPLRNADVFPPTPRLPHHPDVGERMNRDSDLKGVAWPAVPFSSLNEPVLATSSPPRLQNGANLPPSPPRLAVNGITTSAPKSYNPLSRGPNEVSAETEQRRKALEEEQTLYPPPSSASSHGSSSPIIPLSPDPFGRYPSSPEGSGGGQQPVTYWESGRRPSVSIEQMNESDGMHHHQRSASRATSRFSLDSDTSAEPPSSSSKGKEEKSGNRSTLMAVKGLTKLWKKGPKASVSGPVLPPPPTPSLGSRSVSPEVPFRPSMEGRDGSSQVIPSTPTFGRFPTGGPPPVPPTSAGARSGGSLERRPSQEQQQQQQQQQQQHMQQHSLGVPTLHPMNGGMPPLSTQSGLPMPPVPMLAQMQRGAAMRLDRLHFDQESPYPVRRYSPQPPIVNQESNVLTSQQQQQQQSATEKPAAATTASTINGSSPTTTTSAAPTPMGPPTTSTGPRKSILKSWKSAASIPAALRPGSSNVNNVNANDAANNVSEPRASLERPNAGAPRPRRPSVLHFGSSSRTTPSPAPSSSAMPPPNQGSEIPPSPQIPEQYLQHTSSLRKVSTENHKRGSSVTSGATTVVGSTATSIMSKIGLRRSSKSRMSSSESNPPPSMTSSSTASSPPSHSHQPLSSISSSVRSGSPIDSMTSPRESGETRPSFDASQFEIVSPKLGGTLTYPYHALDHDTSG